MMNDEDVRRVFAKNLKFFMDLNHKTQADLVKDLQLPQSTLNNWYAGLKMPRMNKVELLAMYFGIQKSDLIEEKHDKQEEGYYIDSATKQLVQEIYLNPNLKILLDASSKLTEEDINFVLDMVKRLENKTN